MSFDRAWLDEAGLDTETGMGYTGREDKYIAAVMRFFKSYEKNRAKIEEYYESRDYESYMITVHALKSNSRMIGATELGALFEELELAAKAGDTETVENKTGPALSSYAALIEKLKPLEELGEVNAAGEISADEARETADKLLEALDDFNDDLSKELAKKLSGYPFRMTQRDRLKEAAAFIEDFLYDEAAEIIREIYPSIE